MGQAKFSAHPLGVQHDQREMQGLAFLSHSHGNKESKK